MGHCRVAQVCSTSPRTKVSKRFGFSIFAVGISFTFHKPSPRLMNESSLQTPSFCAWASIWKLSVSIFTYARSLRLPGLGYTKCTTRESKWTWTELQAKGASCHHCISERDGFSSGRCRVGDLYGDSAYMSERSYLCNMVSNQQYLSFRFLILRVVRMRHGTESVSRMHRRAKPSPGLDKPTYKRIWWVGPHGKRKHYWMYRLDPN